MLRIDCLSNVLSLKEKSDKFLFNKKPVMMLNNYHCVENITSDFYTFFNKHSVIMELNLRFQVGVWYLGTSNEQRRVWQKGLNCIFSRINGFKLISPFRFLSKTKFNLNSIYTFIFYPFIFQLLIWVCFSQIFLIRFFIQSLKSKLTHLLQVYVQKLTWLFKKQPK